MCCNVNNINWECLQPGFSFPTSAYGNVHVYPFSSEDPCGPAQSCIQHERDARQTVTEKSIVNGVKGPSWLRELTKYDMINGTCCYFVVILLTTDSHPWQC